MNVCVGVVVGASCFGLCASVLPGRGTDGVMSVRYGTSNANKMYTRVKLISDLKKKLISDTFCPFLHQIPYSYHIHANVLVERLIE